MSKVKNTSSSKSSLIMINNQQVSPKAVSILALYKVLRDYSSPKNKLTQSDIIYFLKKDYGIVLERKAVGRKLLELQAMDYSLVKDSEGVYLDEFIMSTEDYKFIWDIIRSDKQIDKERATKIMKDLANFAQKGADKVLNNNSMKRDNNKKDSDAIFETCEKLEKYISDKQVIKFKYCKYYYDEQSKKIVNNNGKEHLVSPYKLIYLNSKYYLLCYDFTIDMTPEGSKERGISMLKVNRIKDIEIVDDIEYKDQTTIEGYEEGIEYSIVSKYPFPYTDKPTRIRLYLKRYAIDQLVDWFGNKLKIETTTSNDFPYIVELKTSENAMVQWCKLYANDVKVALPPNLRKTVAKGLMEAAEQYK